MSYSFGPMHMNKNMKCIYSLPSFTCLKWIFYGWKKKVNSVCIQRVGDLSLSFGGCVCWVFPYVNRLSKILPVISDICIIRVYNDLTLFLLQNIRISWVFLWFNNNKRILVFRIDSNWIHETKVAMWRI